MEPLRRRLIARLERLDGVVRSGSATVAGDGFWVEGIEIAHVDGDGVIAVRLTRRVIRQRRRQLRIDDRVAFPPSVGLDWVNVSCAGDEDIPFVVELVASAARAQGLSPVGWRGAPPRAGVATRRRP